MFKKIIGAIVGTSLVALGVGVVKALKSVGATTEDFVTHNELVNGTYFGKTELWNVNGVTVYGVYSPVTVAASGALYACANYDAGQRVILCYDKNFTELSKEEQYAIACHEAGHMHYSHDFRVRKLENELAADAYAVAVVGKDTMISTLKKIASKKRHDKEIVARINALA